MLNMKYCIIEIRSMWKLVDSWWFILILFNLKYDGKSWIYINKKVNIRKIV